MSSLLESREPFRSTFVSYMPLLYESPMSLQLSNIDWHCGITGINAEKLIGNWRLFQCKATQNAYISQLSFLSKRRQLRLFISANTVSLFSKFEHNRSRATGFLGYYQSTYILYDAIAITPRPGENLWGTKTSSVLGVGKQGLRD